MNYAVTIPVSTDSSAMSAGGDVAVRHAGLAHLPYAPVVSRRDAHGAAPLSPLTMTGACAAVGVAVTLLASVGPSVRFAYRSVPGHASLETADALIAAIVAYLAYGRVRRTHRGRDVLLGAAFGLLAVADLLFACLPAVIGDGTPGRFATWSLLAIRLTGACLLAAAALVRAGGAEQPAVTAVGATVLALCLLVAALAAFRHRLPLPVDPGLSSDQSGRPQLTGNGAVLALQLVHVAPFAVAAAAFTRRARRSGDRVEAWLGAGATLGAFARLNYFLFPSLYTELIYTGDGLRTGFYLLLLVAAAVEVRGYWAAQAEAAVFAERRRVARDLHDGAMQEIGYIRAVAARRSNQGDTEATRVLAAAERALDEMRSAMTALSAGFDEPLSATLRRAACEVADRYDLPLELVLDGSPEVGHEQREALVRIVREAVTNAAKHGYPSKVTVELNANPRTVLVRDDGCGFDPSTRRAGGFGLTSMADRAEGLGGRLRVDSAPGRGTAVTVTW